MQYKTKLITALLAIFALAACGEKQPAAEAPPEAKTAPAAEAAPEPMSSIYEDAVNHASRPEADRARDADRQPAAVLEFVGIEPGMHVLDMFSGGGWYAEVIGHVVGADGRVIAHSNVAYTKFVGDALAERFTDRVPQAEILMAENNQLELQENSLDAVMLALSFHDIYLPEGLEDWEPIDASAFLSELKKGVKPGGIVAIIDHHAAPGSPLSVANTLHRIDPAQVVAAMEAAGFVCEAESQLLRNADDDLSTSVFDEGIRGKTDRFVFRFRNPM